MAAIAEPDARPAADPSARFVSAPGAPLPGNLAALWATDPALAAAVERLDESDADALATEPARDGSPTLAAATPDGRRVYLHSRHRPRDEADRLVAGVDVANHVAFYLFGLGLGYHLDAVFDRAGAEAVFFVFEPDPRVLRAALASRDLSGVIASRRVTFVTAADKAALFALLTPRTAMIALGTAEVEHPASVQRDACFHDQMRKWLAEFAAFATTNLNTLVHTSRRTLENVARNAATYAAAPGPGPLKDLYKGCPAVVVSAGPSLRKNKHRLTELAGKCVIIAVQTTLRPLLEIGVVPDFVTALDYHEICGQYFENLPAGLSTELVAEVKASAVIFDRHPGPVTVLGNPHADALLRELDPGHARLPAGSTVAHLAFYLAEHLGCDPILFVGQDLGFGDGLCYAPGTSHEDVWRPELGRFCTVENKQWEQIVRDRPILRQVPDYRGRPMYTEERLFTYLQQFERDFAKSPARILDCTEGGAAKRGATPMPLAEAIAAYCRSPLPAVRRRASLRIDRTVECVRAMENRRDEAQRVERIARQTLPLLEELRDHVEDQPRVNRVIARIDALRAEMNALTATYDLVTQMTQQTELERFRADRLLAAAKLAGVDRQRRQVLRDVDNCRGVVAAARDFQSLMDDVIAGLSADLPRLAKGVAA